MKVAPHNIVQHELIGLEAHVAASRDPALVCRRGKIVDETKKTLILETARGAIRVTKEGCTFDIGLPDGTLVRVDGHLLSGRPESRMKKQLRWKW